MAAYGEKYYVTYCDPQRNEYRLSIMQRDYSGPATKVVAGPVPFALHTENSNELKIGGIAPTRGVVTLVSSKTFSMEELYTTDELKYKVVHARTDQDPTGYWEGFVIPTGLSEEMDNEVHYIEIQASDRLSSLQGIKFLDDNSENYGISDGVFERSFLYVIKECLLKTGLGLPVRTMVDIHPLLEGTPEQGGIFAESVYFNTFSEGGANQIIAPDPDGSKEDTLSIGGKIAVSGGTNDGRTFTITGWTRNSDDPVGWLYIQVAETPVSTYPNYEAVVLTIAGSSVPSTDFPDPLDITYHDVRTYIDRNSVEEDPDRKWIKPKPYYEFTDGTMMCWRVLENICTIWNVRLIQNNGWWEIRRWNTEALAEGTYEWFEYDSNGVFSGRSPFGKDVLFYCKSTSDVHMPFGHTMSMDRVFKRVTARYNFRYKQDGDSLANLIRDGNFANLGTDKNRWLVINQPITLAPPGLFATKETSNLPAGFETGLRLTGFARSRALTNSMDGYTVEVLKGDNLTLTLWERIDGTATDMAGVYGITLENIVMGNRGQVNQSESRLYDLVNASGIRQVSQRESGLPEYYYAEGKWEERPYVASELLQDKVRFLTVYGRSGAGAWRKIDIDISDMPVSGTLKIEIVGIATLAPTSADRSYDGFPSIGNVVKAYVPRSGMTPRGSEQQYTFELQEIRLVSFRPSPPALLVTGMFLSRITTGEDRERNYIGFMYEQTGNYTDTIEDIDIMNADIDDPDHVGVIRVMNSGELVFTDKWDTWAGDFEWDSLGMVLSRSVMQNYATPMRKIDGDFVAPNMDLGSRIFIERTGGAKYAVLRGSINYIRNMFSGTIVQIGQGEAPAIDKDPDWQPNGVTRCQISPETGGNTGYMELQQVDVNPRSNTYMQSVWVLSSEDTEACPVDQPQPIYWDEVPEGSLPSIENLKSFPYTKDGDAFRVEYNNDGTGRYLMMCFLASLGELRSVLEIEGYESITSWETMSGGMTINGHEYKAYRMSYVTSYLTNHPKTFIIN